MLNRARPLPGKGVRVVEGRDVGHLLLLDLLLDDSVEVVLGPVEVDDLGAVALDGLLLATISQSPKYQGHPSKLIQLF